MLTEDRKILIPLFLHEVPLAEIASQKPQILNLISLQMGPMSKVSHAKKQLEFQVILYTIL